MEIVTQIHSLKSNPLKQINHSEINPEVIFGPIAGFMSDSTIEEIWINSPSRIFIARKGKSELTNLVLTAEEVRELVDRTLMWTGRRLDLSHPFVDARLPDGSRLHVVIPEITSEHWAVNIRKHLMRNLHLRDLSKLGVMSADISLALSNSVIAGLNILVSGGTQSGKTTMLNALASEVPQGQRVITIEEVFELKPNVSDLVQMQTRSANLQGGGEIPLRKLIKEALRMRPSRIIVGEVREAEALDLLIALNSGLPGMGTLHANSCRDAIVKLQTLPLLAGENISHKFVAPTVASAIDLVVHVTLDNQGVRRISEVAAVTGRFENDRAEIESLWKWSGDGYEVGIGSIGNAEKFESAGIPLNSWWRK
jgi:pilus assembly protein CpaF